MRGFIGNLLRIYSANAVAGVLGILFVPYAVHRLGAAGYGILSIYVVLASYVALVEVGLGRGVVKALGAESTEAGTRAVLRAASALYLAICALLLASIPALLWLVPRFVFPVPPAELAALRAVTAFAVFEYVLGVPASLVQNRAIAELRFAPYSRYLLATSLLRYGLSFGVLFVISRPEVLVGALALRRLVDVAIAWRMLGALPSGSLRPSMDRARFAVLLRSSTTMSLGQILNLSLVAAGSVLVNRSFGIVALGAFRAAFDIASKLWFFSNAIGMVVFPKFVQLWARLERRRELASLIPKVLLASLVSYGAVAVVGGALAAVVLDALALRETVARELFVLLVAGVSLNAHGTLGYEFVQAAGGGMRAAAISAGALALLVATFAVTAPVAPTLAIGWAWLVSQSVATVAWDAVVLSYLGLGSRRVVGELLLRVAAVSAIALAVVAALRPAAPVVWFAASVLALPLVVEAARRVRSLRLHPASV